MHFTAITVNQSAYRCGNRIEYKMLVNNAPQRTLKAYGFETKAINEIKMILHIHKYIDSKTEAAF